MAQVARRWDVPDARRKTRRLRAARRAGCTPGDVPLARRKTCQVRAARRAKCTPEDVPRMRRPGRLFLRAACVRLKSVSNGATSLGRQGHRASPAAPATQGACTELEPRRAARKLKEGRAGARAASVCVCGGAAVVGPGTPLRLPGPFASVPSRRSRRPGSRELERETAGNECVMAGRLWSARVHLCGYRSRPHPSRLFVKDKKMMTISSTVTGTGSPPSSSPRKRG